MKAPRAARMLRAAPIGRLSGVRVRMTEGDHERARELVAGLQALDRHDGWTTLVVSYVSDPVALRVIARGLAADLRRLRRAGLDVSVVRPWRGVEVVERCRWLRSAT